MPTYTRKTVLKALGFPETEETKSALTITASQTGPAGAADLGAMLRGRANIWKNINVIPPKKSSLKFIWAHPLHALRKDGPENEELAFMSTLFECGEFYLWPGKDKPLTEARQLINTDAFWKERGHAAAATREEIMKSLSAQGKTAEGMVILDLDSYQTAMENLYEGVYRGYSHRFYMLTNADEFINAKGDERKLASGSFTSITTYGNLSDSEITNLFELFPYLKEITLRAVNAEWVAKNLHRFNGKKVKLSEYESTIFTYPSNCELSGLSFYSAYNLKSITFDDTLDHANSGSLQSLTLSHCANLEKISLKSDARKPLLSVFKNLQRIEIKSCDRLKGITSTPSNQPIDKPAIHCFDPDDVKSSDKYTLATGKKLSEITESHEWKLDLSAFKEFNLDKNNEVKSITITSPGPLEKVSLKGSVKMYYTEKLSQLKELKFHPDCKVNSLEIRSCPIRVLQTNILKHLKELRLYDVEIKNIEGLNPNIEVLELYGPVEFDISTLHALNEFKWTRPSLTVINAPNTAIKKMVLSNAEPFPHFVALKQIEELEINECKIDHLDWPRGLVLKRLIINNCNALKNLDLSLFTGLEEIVINNCDTLETLIFNAPNLKRVQLINTKYFTKFDFTKSPQLEVIKISGASVNLESVSMKNLSQLKSIEIETGTAYTSPEHEKMRIDCSGCDKLIHFKIRDHTRHNLDLNYFDCRKLKHVWITVQGNLNLYNIDSCDNLKSVGEIYCYNPREIKERLVSSLPGFDLASNRRIGFSGYGEEKEISTTPSLTDAELKLNQHNQLQKRLRYSGGDTANSLDHQTGKTPILTGETPDDFSVELYDKKNGGAEPANYRLAILDRVQFADKKISFFPAEYKNTEGITLPIIEKKIDETLLAEIKAKVNVDESSEMGHFYGTLVPGKQYPVGASQTQSRDSMLEFNVFPPGMLLRGWDNDRQQHFFELKPGITSPQKIDIAYRVRKNEAYEETHQAKLDKGYELAVKEHSLLPEELHNMLAKKINTFAELSFLHAKLTSAEKYRKLQAYFLGQFQQQAIPEEKSSFDTLWNIIQTRSGVCRHRAQAFMVLAHYIGVPVRIMQVPGLHQYIETPYRSADKKLMEWGRLDLGGGELIDLRPPAADAKPLLASILAPPQPKRDESKRDTPVPLSAKDQAVKEFIAELFRKVKEKSQIRSLSELMLKPNPLVELAAGQTPAEANRYFFQEMQRQGLVEKRQYVYIDRPADLSLYFNPIRLRESKLETVPGPLQTIAREGGVIVVNWDNFSPEEILSYKIMLDTEAKLLDIPLSKKCKVIGVTTKPQEDKAFRERCTPVSVPAIPLAETKTTAALASTPVLFRATAAAPPEIKTIPVDLFGMPLWVEEMLGSPIYKETGITLTKARVVEAMRKENGMGLHIYNPPDDPEFHDFISQIKNERRVLYQGEWIDALPNFSVTVTTKSHAGLIKDTESQITIDTKNLAESKAEEKKNTIYLGLYNFYDLFSRLKIASGKTEHQPGLLESFREGDTFYITQNFPANYWEKLLSHIKENHPDKKFHFTLSPGVEIENVAKNELTVAPPTINTRAYMSNDPDYFTQQLVEKHKGEDVFVVHVSAQTTLSDLLAKSDLLSASYKETDVLKKCRAGKKIIVSGDISPTLYYQLLPLLETPPRLALNGEVTILPPESKLFIVAPELPTIVPIKQQNITEDMYKRAFPGKEKNVDKIIAFFKYANEWPHLGEGRPTLPKLSYQRIHNMLNALEERHPLHQNNPIKGFFLYDYPRYSEDYAYLNVIAKCLFSPSREHTQRDKKLDKWKRRYHLISSEQKRQHQWKLLNCFSGADIRRILGDDFSKSIVLSDGCPRLTEAAFAKLLTEMAQPVKPHALGAAAPAASVEEEKLVPAASKEKKTLETLLADPTKPIIFLKGPAGSGKTYRVENIIDEKIYNEEIHQGLDSVMAWLKDPSPKITILLIDEANMFVPGTLEFFKGLYSGKLFYGNEFHDIPPHKKLFITGNPEYYPNRHFDPFIQEYVYTVYVPQPSREELIKQIKPLLDSDRKMEYADRLIDACEILSKHHPYFDVSRREAKNLALRFIVLSRGKTRDEDIEQALLQACLSEFSGGIQDTQWREQFEKALLDILGIVKHEEKGMPPLTPVVPGFSLPSGKRGLIDAIEQAMLMREYSINKKEIKPSYKTILLIEGAPGVGKTSLFCKYLESKGYSQHGGDKPYFQDSGGTATAKDVIRKAHRNGHIVVLDELNADPTLEKFIIDLEKTPSPGFMIFASQNARLTAVSEAMRSRSHYIYVDEFERHELTALASEKLPLPEANEYVKTYQASGLSMRSFHSILEDARKYFVEQEKFEIFACVTFLMQGMPGEEKIKEEMRKDMSRALSLLVKPAEELKDIPKTYLELYLRTNLSRVEKTNLLFHKALNGIELKENNLLQVKERLMEAKDRVYPYVDPGVFRYIQTLLKTHETQLTHQTLRRTLFSGKKPGSKEIYDAICTEIKKTSPEFETIRRLIISRISVAEIKAALSEPGKPISHKPDQIYIALYSAILIPPFSIASVEERFNKTLAKLTHITTGPKGPTAGHP